MEWQMIGTAPRDGSKILTCRLDARYDASIKVCAWRTDQYDGDRWMDDADTEPDPTHWMPLPAPPIE